MQLERDLTRRSGANQSAPVTPSRKGGRESCNCRVFQHGQRWCNSYFDRLYLLCVLYFFVGRVHDSQRATSVSEE